MAFGMHPAKVCVPKTTIITQRITKPTHVHLCIHVRTLPSVRITPMRVLMKPSCLPAKEYTWILDFIQSIG